MDLALIAETHAKTRKGITLLHCAAMHSTVASVEILIAARRGRAGIEAFLQRDDVN